MARWLLVVLGGLLMAVLISLMAWAPGLRAQRRRLPDGGTVGLERVEWGKEHRFMVGYPGLKRITQYLPPFLRFVIPPSAEHCINNSVPTLALWFSSEGIDWPKPTHATPFGVFAGAPEPPRAFHPPPMLVDDHGCVYWVGSWGRGNLLQKPIGHMEIAQ